LKRIAFLGRGVHTIPSYRELLNRLSETHSVTVFCETPIDKEWLKWPRRYRLVSMCVRGVPLRVNFFLFFLSVLGKHLLKPFDFLHAHSTFPTGLVAVIMKRFFGVKAIVSLDGGEGIAIEGVAFGDLHSSRRTKINSYVLNHADVVSALTQFHADLIIKNLEIQRKILVIPRGTDVAKFNFDSTRIISHPVHFLSVGYLSPIKNPQLLLETFTALRNRIACKLTIVGYDYLAGQVQKLAMQFGIEKDVEFVGHVEHEKIPGYYQQADILLMTSRYESQSMAVVEAMAAGVVVCGTQVGLLHDLSFDTRVAISSENGLALADAVLRILEEPERTSKMRTAAREWVIRHSIEETTRRWNAIYLSV
jgi:glycosyltransferase involved in cell wall biosynthesis